MIKEFKLRGHIIDSLVLSKLLDKIDELGAQCRAANIEVGQRRKDVSKAVFTIETNDENIMKKAVEIALRQGAQEIL